MKTMKIMAATLLATLLYSCGLTLPTTISKNKDFSEYKYFYIEQTTQPAPKKTQVTMTVDDGFGGTSYVVGGANKALNPYEIIADCFTDEKFIEVRSIDPSIAAQTFIITYSEKAQTSFMKGSTLDIQINCVAADTQVPICTGAIQEIDNTDTFTVRLGIEQCVEKMVKEPVVM